MRPADLAPLFASVQDLPGVGAKVAEHLEALCGPRVVDLLWHRPLRFVDRRLRESLGGLEPGQTATLELRIGSHQKPGRKGLPYRIPCLHKDGGVTLVFFNARGAWLEGQFPEGSTRLVSGKVVAYQGAWQMVHPDLSLPIEKADDLPGFEPVYPSRAGLGQRTLGKAIEAAVKRVPSSEEWMDGSLREQRGWASFEDALTALHTTPGEAQMAERLAYDEALAGQVALAVLRDNRRAAKGPNLTGTGQLTRALQDTLPYDLTNDQMQAVAAISARLKGPDQATTLVQGDVGSGKTLVALMLMLQAVEAGTQATLMAPTEILARQHAQTLSQLTQDLPVEVVCLTGKDTGAARKALTQQISEGRAQIIVGTHALFQEGVSFDQLGLVVIDEQHRFGVQQRLALTQKGAAPHLILMSATPIPRTLVMVAYGDLDVIEIREKPAGRQPIRTLAKPTDALPEVLRSFERLLATGQQAYWICPLFEESEALPGVMDVTTRFRELQKHFGPQIGLIHGQMPAEEKDATMAAFKAGDIRALVATTVIEVGVDVPNATLMVIEQAERFGLAQMHQIRGRIGRGDLQGTCLMLYGQPLSATAKTRLEAMRASGDGFYLSEQDLKLRGGGEILGTRQSGLPETRFVDYGLHGELLRIAQKDARNLLSQDPSLSGERGQAVRRLLYLFGQDQVAPLLKVG